MITRNSDTTIASLMNYHQALHLNSICNMALDIFIKDNNLFAIPVLNDQNNPVGVIERAAFTEIFIKDFSKALHGKKPIHEFMDKNPLIFDIKSSLERVAEIVAKAKKRYLLSGFIITVENQYAGVGNIHDLIAALSKIRHDNLFYLAHVDQLTKLPNRLLLTDRLEKAFNARKRLHSEIAVIFIDLDNFKYFNDSFGHSFGDRLLVAFAERLLGNARANDTVARLAGDEFVILIEHVTDETFVHNFAHRIIDSMKKPLVINDNEFYISASVGYAVSEGNDNANSLLLKADSAMYLAKKFGKNNFKKYDVCSTHRLNDEGNSINQLHTALVNDEFTLYFQPQYHANTGQIVGKEALIRWKHPSRGLLTPIHFIELAEKSGLIIDIGESVFKKAFRQQRAWNTLPASDDTSISVNVSPVQLFQENFCHQIVRSADEIGLNPNNVCIELTESLLLHDLEGAIRVLNNLKKYGFKIALDDFGTGYSNLSYLKKLPIDSIKIDQVFVRNIHQDRENQVIVNAINSIAKALNFEVIAEGIEKIEELNTIKELDIDIIQGYLFSKPLTSEQLTEELSLKHALLVDRFH